MKRLLWVSLLILSVMVFSCQKQESRTKSDVSKRAVGEKLNVVVTIQPLADFVRQIGGDRVDVSTLVPPGVSPHTFEPTPGQVMRLSKADLIVKIGAGLEFWLEDMIESSGNADAPVVETAAPVDLITHIDDTHDHGDHEAHGQGNPHIWLSPKNALEMTVPIANALYEIDPTHRADYADRFRQFKNDLQKLDQAYRDTIATFSQKKFIAAHGAWVYLARDYALDQAAVVVEFEGREPTPETIVRLIETARELNARAIFTEPQLNPKATNAIAAETGLEVITLDPLGAPDDPERATYVKLMRYNLSQFKKGLQ